MGDLFACRNCGETTKGMIPGFGTSDIVVRTYRGSQAQAAAAMAAEAAVFAKDGYRPASQSWADGQWGAGAYLVGLLLILAFGIGLLVLLYLVVVKPAGTLTVTYQRPEAPAAPTKVCPDCGETVLATARLCRFCRHEFPAVTA